MINYLNYGLRLSLHVKHNLISQHDTEVQIQTFFFSESCLSFSNLGSTAVHGKILLVTNIANNP